MIIPSILSFSFLGPSVYLDSLADFYLDLSPLVMWIATTGAQSMGHNRVNITVWGNILVRSSLAASMTVNALVTGLIVLKLFKVFRGLKGVTTSLEKHWGIIGGRKMASIMFIVIESGMALFAIQLTRLVITTTNQTDAEYDALVLIIPIHIMLNVIISSSHYFIFY